jgi:hypothetical protein
MGRAMGSKNGKRHDLNSHERYAPEKSSPMKPLAPLGAKVKYFRNETFEGEHVGMDPTYEHEKNKRGRLWTF